MVLVLRSSHIDEAGILQASKQSRLYSYIFPKFFDRRYSSGERQNCFLNTAESTGGGSYFSRIDLRMKF
jgi:hypothetical protein